MILLYNVIYFSLLDYPSRFIKLLYMLVTGLKVGNKNHRSYYRVPNHTR